MNYKIPVRSELYSKEYYLKDNEGGNVYVESLGRKASYRLNRCMALSKLKKGNNILDIGCGRGEIIIQGALIGAQGLGIDYSKDSIKLCNSIKKRFPKELRNRMKFLNLDIKKANFHYDYYDCVFMLDVIEHLHDWEIKISLDKIKQSLKKTGTLIIHTTPNTDFYKYGYPIIRRIYPILSFIFPSVKKLIDTKPNWKNRTFLPKDPEEGQKYNKEGHINEQNPERLRRILKEAGFYPKLTLVPFTREIKGPFIKIIYLLLSLPLIRNIFCAEIFAVCKK